jgi:hypothetical protein
VRHILRLKRTALAIALIVAWPGPAQRRISRCAQIQLQPDGTTGCARLLPRASQGIANSRRTAALTLTNGLEAARTRHGDRHDARRNDKVADAYMIMGKRMDHQQRGID